MKSVCLIQMKLCNVLPKHCLAKDICFSVCILTYLHVGLTIPLGLYDTVAK